MLRESDLVRALRRKKPQALPAVVEAATKAPFPARLRRPSAQKARGPLPNAGLKNLGNTCFMNATLQCLFGCAEFCSGFIERQYPLSSSSPAQGKIAMSFAELLTDISQDKPIVSPSNLRKALTKISPQFRGNGQHDSQELLRCLLDGLAEDLKRPPPPSPVTLPRNWGAIFVRLFRRFDGDTMDLSWAMSVSNSANAIATLPCAEELDESGYWRSINPEQNSAQPNKHCKVAFIKHVLPRFFSPV